MAQRDRDSSYDIASSSKIVAPRTTTRTETCCSEKHAYFFPFVEPLPEDAVPEKSCVQMANGFSLQDRQEKREDIFVVRFHFHPGNSTEELITRITPGARGRHTRRENHKHQEHVVGTREFHQEHDVLTSSIFTTQNRNLTVLLSSCYFVNNFSKFLPTTNYSGTTFLHDPRRRSTAIGTSLGLGRPS